MSAITDGVLDVRQKLYRNSRGGPKRSVPLASKRGLIVHWYGETVGNDDMAALVSASSYHAITKDWSPEVGIQHGDGLMYHLAVGQDGQLYWCRDIEAVLWHCGAWPENEIALAVLVLCAANRPPTLQQYAGLRTVVDRWRTIGHTDRPGVKGHLEVSSNTCPGPDLMRWVRGYRGEVDAPATPDEVLEAYWQANRARLGEKRKPGAGALARDWGGEKVLLCERGVVAYQNGQAVDITQRSLDDLITGFWLPSGALTYYE
jgi:hypothetical protein